MQVLRLLSIIAITAALNACSSGVDTPKGTSKGYSSARLVARKTGAPASTGRQQQIHGMIQKSIASRFSAHGMAYNQAGADLVVGYLVVFQDNAMTTYFDEYFGYGRDPDEISDLAHKKGVIEGTRPDHFERAGIVIDVIDARTNKLVYRDFASGDIVQGVSDSTRAQRIDRTVQTALASFFRK